jgi:prolyl 4-hydroxylase
MVRYTTGLLLAAVWLLGGALAEKSQKPLGSDADSYTCAHPAYKIHLLSKSPLVIYIADFLTPAEREHLQKLS